jgi:G3E family GTPase
MHWQVRGDLVRILTRLLKRKTRFDAILIETTGLADPAPVAQTFFVEEKLAASLQLDAIVTVVDAKHIEQHLDDDKPEGVENEASRALSKCLLMCLINVNICRGLMCWLIQQTV